MALAGALLFLGVVWTVANGQNLVDIRGISKDKGARYLQQQAGAPVSTGSSSGNNSFVTVQGANLELNGAKLVYKGFNSYYLLQKASFPEGKKQVTDTLDLAQRLGLTVGRTWAYSDGAKQQPPLQVELGRLDPAALQNLDWVVSQAEQRDIKLILTLTNYWFDYGGIQQYVDWVNSSNASTVVQFYTDPSLQAAYKDFATAIILRKNSITGQLYRDDPTIMAWDLINEPACLGDESGDTLHDWLDDVSTYIKSIDANHLIYYGTSGFFGASSPGQVSLNPRYNAEYVPYGAPPWDTACQGEDWARNIKLPNIDLASQHVYPDLFGTVEADLARIQAHIQAARDAGKPYVLDELGAKRPQSSRTDYLRQVFQLISKEGSPLAGTNIWNLVADTYPDYDQFSLYGSEAGVSQPLPDGDPMGSARGDDLRRKAVFRGYFAADACVRRRFQKADYVAGWQDTLSILSSQ